MKIILVVLWLSLIVALNAGSDDEDFNDDEPKKESIIE